MKGGALQEYGIDGRMIMVMQIETVNGVLLWK